MTRTHRLSGTSATATRLVVGCLVLLALLPPTLFLAAGLLFEHRQAHGAAAVAVWAAQRSGDAAERDRLPQQLLAGQAAPAAWFAVLDDLGRVRAEAGLRPPWPAVGVTLAFTPATRDHAAVSAERSLRPLVVGSMLVALLAAGVALALWRYAYLKPVRRLRQAEGHIVSHARLDPLTGLLNREGLRERLLRTLERSSTRGPGTGVLVIDIDRFNLVNGTLGQAAGDALLCGVAERLRSVTRQGDPLARLAGDQFGVLVQRIYGPDVMSAMARNLLRAFETPIVVDGHDIVVSISLGGAVADAQTQTVDDMLRHAIAAMRAVKATGGGRFVQFQAAMDDGSERRLEMDLRLRRALAADQFFLLYQPLVAARGGRVAGVEALLRWRDPERGVMGPDDFVPVLEQTGLIVPVGLWVLQEACRRAMQWRREGHADLLMSVNLSPRQFSEPDFLDKLAGVLQSTGLPPSYLQLEVTEGLLLEPTAETLGRLDALVALGVRVAVDDFGMGYSSLAYLKRFKLHSLKIDRLFVNDMSDEVQAEAIVRAVIDLGHGLGLSVTAEGVETEGQAQTLRHMGCDLLQGYLFSRPVPPEQLMLAGVPDAEPAPAELAAAVAA